LMTHLPRITRGWEAEGLEEEVKVCIIPLILYSLFNRSRTTVTATWKLLG
jgi:hypothetical protein